MVGAVTAHAVHVAGRLLLGTAGPLGIGLLAWMLTGAAKDGQR